MTVFTPLAATELALSGYRHGSPARPGRHSPVPPAASGPRDADPSAGCPFATITPPATSAPHAVNRANRPRSPRNRRTAHLHGSVLMAAAWQSPPQKSINLTDSKVDLK